MRSGGVRVVGGRGGGGGGKRSKEEGTVCTCVPAMHMHLPAPPS